MAPTSLRRAGATVVAVLLAAGALGWAPAASARPAAACPVGDGITVVVDFGPLGGGVQIRCVTTSVSSGFDALEKAGFTYAGAQRFPGLLCRIDGKPADDPCVSAPPSNRYWAYWTATAPGGSWTYSDQGAGNRVPPPGSVEGWAFSAGCDRQPGAGPCPGGTTTTTTAYRPPETPTTAMPSGGGRTPPSATAAAGVAEAPGESSTTTKPGAETTTTRASDRAPAAGEPGDDEVSALAGAVAARDSGDADGASGGSAAGAVVGALAVLGLGGAGLMTARRRRGVEGGH